MPEVKAIYDTTLFGSPDPSGLTYDPVTGRLILVDSEVDEEPFNNTTNLFVFDPATGLGEGHSLSPVTDEPTGIVYSEATGTFFVTDDNTGMVYEVVRDDLSRIVSTFSATNIGVSDVEGIAVGAGGNLFLVDSSGAIVETTVAGDFVSRIDLPNNIKRSQSIAYDVDENVFYVAGSSSANIYKVSPTGELLDRIKILRDYRNAEGDRPAPTGLNLVKNEDGTTSLWISDGGTDGVSDGRLFEITLDPPPLPPASPSVSVSNGSPNPQLEQTDSQIVFSVELSEPLSEDVIVTYSTVDGTAKDGEDFVGATNETVTIAANSTSALIAVDLIDDKVTEANESFSLVIDSAVGSSSGTVLDIVTATGTGNIVDDDTAESDPVTVALQQGLNGYTGTVDTMLQEESPTLSAGTAPVIGVDSGTGQEVQALLIFDGLFGSGPGEIPVGATIASAFLTLQTSNGSTQGGALHRLSGDWNDTATWASFGDGVQTDGVEAVTSADLITGAVTTGPTELDVTKSVLAWASAGTTSEAQNAANQGWVFIAGGTDGWDFYSSEGSVAPQLTVTYTTDGTPPPPGPTVSIQTGSPNPQSEGADAPITFPVTLDAPTTEEVIVEYTTVSGTAVAGEDFVAETGSVTIPANGISPEQPITIDLIDDTTAEPEETFGVQVTAAYFNDASQTPINIAGDGSAEGNVADDDAVTPPDSNVIRVPEDYATIQQAVDAASDGDTILVAPGTYDGGIDVSGRSVTLTSYYDFDNPDGDQSIVDDTIIRGGSPAIDIGADAPDTIVKGFHFIESNYSVVFNAPGGQAIDNFFDDTAGDAVSFERVGGIALGNRFFSVGDDAVDVDGPRADVLIEGNFIDVSGDDGIEIRNFDYSGPLVTVTIADNSILGSLEDGIQIIDYPADSDRMFVIERNLIEGSEFVGIGLMDNGETREDFRAASIPESVFVFNNTLDNNDYAISGGGNLVAVNNIISNSSTLGLKGVDGNSTVAYTLFYGNAADYRDSNVDTATATTGDPRYTSDYALQPDSPAIDAGTATFVHNGQTILDVPSSEYSGTTVDLGWSEFWI